MNKTFFTEQRKSTITLIIYCTIVLVWYQISPINNMLKVKTLNCICFLLKIQDIIDCFKFPIPTNHRSIAHSWTYVCSPSSLRILSPGFLATCAASLSSITYRKHFIGGLISVFFYNFTILRNQMDAPLHLRWGELLRFLI